VEPAWPSSTNPDDYIIIRPQKGTATLKTDASSKGESPPSGSKSTPTSPPPSSHDKSQTPPTTPQPNNSDVDYWFVVAIEGQRAGYVHWSIQRQEQKGKEFLIGTRYLRLTVARFGQVVTQWSEESSVETRDGQVLVTSMRQGLGKDQALALSGTVEGKTLKVRGTGIAAGATDTPWPEGVIGVAGELQQFRHLSLQPGQAHRYLTYIPAVNRVVTITLTLEGEETRVLWPNTPPRRLLRYVSKPEPLDKIRLPMSITWVDAQTREPLLVETDFPAFGGRLTFLRTTREAATTPVSQPVEIFAFQSIPLNRAIPNPHGQSEIVYLVRVPREEEPETLFVTDSRQQVKNYDPGRKSLELHVQARRGPQENIQDPPPGKEYLESNFFLNWDNEDVKRLATQATAGLAANADAWAKACAIERWVHKNMKAFELSQAMASADQVAKHLTGDCTEYAMLAAAMCRAVGIPSRTAMGVIYATDKKGQPALAYHMWFEVYVSGQWVPLDATRGEGGVGPGHIKITQDSWHEEKSFAPLLPVLRVLTARPQVEVLRFRP
jgi:transglutaminase-like putative cysteine protease